MRHVGGVQPAQRFPTQAQDLPGGEELVQAAQLVRLDVGKGDERKEPPRAGVKEQGLFVGDQVLVEVEAPAGDLRSRA